MGLADGWLRALKPRASNRVLHRLPAGCKPGDLGGGRRRTAKGVSPTAFCVCPPLVPSVHLCRIPAGQSEKPKLKQIEIQNR